MIALRGWKRNPVAGLVLQLVVTSDVTFLQANEVIVPGLESFDPFSDISTGSAPVLARALVLLSPFDASELSGPSTGSDPRPPTEVPMPLDGISAQAPKANPPEGTVTQTPLVVVESVGSASPTEQPLPTHARPAPSDGISGELPSTLNPAPMVSTTPTSVGSWWSESQSDGSRYMGSPEPSDSDFHETRYSVSPPSSSEVSSLPIGIVARLENNATSTEPGNVTVLPGVENPVGSDPAPSISPPLAEPSEASNSTLSTSTFVLPTPTANPTRFADSYSREDPKIVPLSKQIQSKLPSASKEADSTPKASTSEMPAPSSDPPLSDDPPLTVPPTTENPIVPPTPTPTPTSEMPAPSSDPPLSDDPPLTVPPTTENPIVPPTPTPTSEMPAPSSDPPLSDDPPLTVPSTTGNPLVNPPQPVTRMPETPDVPAFDEPSVPAISPVTELQTDPPRSLVTPTPPLVTELIGSEPPTVSPTLASGYIPVDSDTARDTPEPVQSVEPNPSSLELAQEPSWVFSSRPSVDPPVPDVPIGIETNDGATKITLAEALAKREEDEYVTTVSPTQSPDTDWEDTAEHEKYVRGQTPIDDVSDPWSGISGNQTGDTSGQSKPLIIGGKNRGTANVVGTPYAETGTIAHCVVRYVASIISAVSVALLLSLHFMSLDPTLRWTNPAWSPNAWEFCVYTIHLQQMASLSELTLLKSPYYLWDYTDAFAWSKFLIPRPSSISSRARRRLETVLVLDGVVGFADRIGLKETEILEYTVTGFAIAMGAFAFVFCGAAFIARWYSPSHGSSRSAFRIRTVVYRLLGLCWLLCFFSIYPLSVMASFEIWMEIYSNLFTPHLLALAIAALVSVCLIVPAIAMRAVQRKTQEQLREYTHIATYGAFYLDMQYSRRLFFVLWLLVQLSAGLSIGVLYTNELLLSILIGIQAAYTIAILVLKPFTDRTLWWMSMGASILAVTNFALGHAFLRGTFMPLKRRNAFADAFIGLNTGVILLWFGRHLIMFANAVRAVLRRHDETHEAMAGQLDVEMAKHHVQAGSFIDPLTSNEILPLVFRLGWSRSMSLGGSTSAAWPIEGSALDPERTPRSTYRALSSSSTGVAFSR